MNNMKIGWSEVDITPSKKASLAGQFAERISEYVEKPITATAFAVEQNGDQMVLCSVDILSISERLVTMVRDRLANNGVGLDPMKVVISAIHTHTAPGILGWAQEYKYPVLNTRQFVLDLLPEGRKYTESAPVTNNPDIITAAEFTEFLADRLSSVILGAWKKRKATNYIKFLQDDDKKIAALKAKEAKAKK